MTYRKFSAVWLSLAMLMFAGTAFATSSGLRFYAALSGEQEVPPVETTSSARGLVFFDAGFSRVHVRIDLRGPLDVVGAHFHCGRAGTNGPVAFGIMNPGPLLEVSDRTRVTLTNADFTGADCVDAVGRPVNNIAALALAMRDGLIYLNVHTPTAPGGEVRGQMLEFGR
jgi:hypothetical protein